MKISYRDIHSTIMWKQICFVFGSWHIIILDNASANHAYTPILEYVSQALLILKQKEFICFFFFFELLGNNTPTPTPPPPRGFTWERERTLWATPGLKNFCYLLSALSLHHVAYHNINSTQSWITNNIGLPHFGEWYGSLTHLSY